MTPEHDKLSEIFSCCHMVIPYANDRIPGVNIGIRWSSAWMVDD